MATEPDYNNGNGCERFCYNDGYRTNSEVQSLDTLQFLRSLLNDLAQVDPDVLAQLIALASAANQTGTVFDSTTLCCDGVWLPGFEPQNLYALPSERNARYGVLSNGESIGYWVSLHGTFYVPMSFENYPFDKYDPIRCRRDGAAPNSHSRGVLLRIGRTCLSPCSTTGAIATSSSSPAGPPRKSSPTGKAITCRSGGLTTCESRTWNPICGQTSTRRGTSHSCHTQMKMRRCERPDSRFIKPLDVRFSPPIMCVLLMAMPPPTFQLHP